MPQRMQFKSLYPSSNVRRVIIEKNAIRHELKVSDSKTNTLSKWKFLNPTLFKGEVYFKFEKGPYWSSGRDKLCKVLYDLKFTTLSSRIKNYSYDESKLTDIDKRLGCIVRPELVGNLDDINDPNNELYKQSKSIENLNHSLYCYCIKSRKYAGELSNVSWLLKYEAKIDDEYPHIAYSEKFQKWFGWSHRAMNSFGIGDMLFDENWTGKNSRDEVEKMKFTDRGDTIISDMSMARQAAINFAKYVG